MDAPQSFQRALEAQFDGQLRVRWSNRQQNWQVEQKVGPHREAPIREDSDDMVRARDGFVEVMAITPGDRMPCPECRSTLSVPLFHTAEVVCEFCKVKGRRVSVTAGHFSLNDRLLEHLRMMDPTRGGSQRLKDQADRNNAARLASLQRHALNQVTAGADDHYRALVGIPLVGYTGKEFRG